VVACLLAGAYCSSDRQLPVTGQLDGTVPRWDAATPPADGDSDADSDGDDDDDGICDEMELAINRVKPKVLIILDRSNSMVDHGNWTAVRNAISAVTGTLDRRLAFGLMVFPSADGAVQCSASANGCEPGHDPLVPCGVGTSTRIDRALSDLSTCGGTPTAETLQGASLYFGVTIDPSHLPPVEIVPSYVLLATDGAPNCNGRLDDERCRCTGRSDDCTDMPTLCLDDERTLEAIAGLRARGVPVYVVGIAATAWRDVLDRMAAEGGTERALMADDQEAIQEAFESITGRVTSCDFVIRDVDARADPEEVNVYLDGEAVPMDADGECDSGWGWVDRDHTRLTLCGPQCDALLAGEVGVVDATFGCPTLI